MLVKFYKNSSDKNTVSKDIADEYVIDVVLKDSTSVLNPSLLLSLDITGYNYVYIPEFDRYYYTGSPVYVRNGLWEVSASVDVLMSFKNSLLATPAILSRASQNDSNLYIQDRAMTTQQNENIYIKEFPNKLEHGKSYVMVTVGSYYKRK